MTWRVLRWWLPWLLTLGVSSALAYAGEAGLERSTQAATTVQVPPRTSTGAERWVSISAIAREEEVMRMQCLARPDMTSADVLSVEFEEFDRLVANMCLELLAN